MKSISMKTQKDGIKQVTLTFETEDVSLNNLKMEASKAIGDLFVKNGEPTVESDLPKIKVGDWVQSLCDRPQEAGAVRGQILSVDGFDHDGRTIVVKDYKGSYWYLDITLVSKVTTDALAGRCVEVLSSGGTSFSEGSFGIIDRCFDVWKVANVIAKSRKTGTLVEQAMELSSLRLV